jgi:hypothetical protein
LEFGCREVWTTDRAAIGVERDDSDDEVERMQRLCKPVRRFAYHGQFQDRNQHQMSGRVQ